MSEKIKSRQYLYHTELANSLRKLRDEFEANEKAIEFREKIELEKARTKDQAVSDRWYGITWHENEDGVRKNHSSAREARSKAFKLKETKALIDPQYIPEFEKKLKEAGRYAADQNVVHFSYRKPPYLSISYYVVKYYIDPNTPEHIQKLVDTTIATIPENTDGRFKFEKVNKPDSADVKYMSVKEGKFAGQYDPRSATVTLNEQEFGPSIEKKFQVHVIIHETGHALGLKHPHNDEAKDQRGAVNEEKASFNQTTMTYDVNNNQSSNPGYYQTLFKLADLMALKELYPLHSDRASRGFKVVAEVAPSTKTTVSRKPDVATAPTNKVFDETANDTSVSESMIEKESKPETPSIITIEFAAKTPEEKALVETLEALVPIKRRFFIEDRTTVMFRKALEQAADEQKQQTITLPVLKRALSIFSTDTSNANFSINTISQRAQLLRNYDERTRADALIVLTSEILKADLASDKIAFDPGLANNEGLIAICHTIRDHYQGKS